MEQKIIQIGDEKLRIVCEEIPELEITSKETKKILKDLDKALKTQKDGVAISAPQIGITKQIFVIGDMIFDKDFQSGKTKTQNIEIKNRYYINPKIIKTSKETVEMEEGCLSIRGVYGKVTRPKKIILEYYNEHGDYIKEGASGFLSRVIQHEYDHLHGILFIDKAHEIWQDDKYKEY